MARSPRGAGELVELVAFDRREAVDDGYGNTVAGPFAEQYRCRAAFIQLRGSEPVMAARLESRQTMVVRIRISAEARAIGTDWQMRDVHHDDEAYNIRTITEDASRAWIDLLVERGVAT